MSLSRPLSIIGLLMFGAGAALAPGGAAAQSDPATQQLIERLTPPAATRGIRVPGAADAAPAPQQAPVQAAPVFTPPPPPAPSAGPPVAGPVTAAPPAARPQGGKPGEPRGPAAARATTAPEGAGAASLQILFASGSAVLTPEGERRLAPLGQALTSQQLANYRFRIEGHTDTVGDAASNQALSERRAAAVREYLIQRFGVRPERLEAVGLGESQPLVPTPDETPNQNNRRVQVVTLGG